MNLAADKFPEERFGLITGSRCSPLFPQKSAEVGQRTLAKKLANELYFKFHDELETWQMEHGTLAEKYAFLHFQKYHDKDIQEGRFMKIGDCGGTTDAEGSDYGVDFKCPTTLDKFLSYLYDGPDEDQINQARWYMYLTGKKRWLIAPYLVETAKMADFGLVYPMKDDSKRMMLYEVLPDEEWLKKREKNVPVVIKMRDEFLERLKTRFDK